MRSRSLVFLTLLLAFMLAVPSSSHAGFFSIFRKLLPLRVRILLGVCSNSDIPKIISKVEGLYTFPQQEGLGTFTAEMLELSTRAANDFNKQWTKVSYQATPEGGDAKIEAINKGTVSKDTQKGVNQGMNVPGAKEFGNALFPRSPSNEKVAYPNVKVRAKAMFPFSFFINDAALEFRPYSPKSYAWKIDSAAQNGQMANNALGLAGDNVDTANGMLGDVASGIQGAQQSAQSGLSGIISFLQQASGMLSGLTGKMNAVNGLLGQALSKIQQGRDQIGKAQGFIQEGSGKIADINKGLDGLGGKAGKAGEKVKEALGKADEVAKEADRLLGVIDGLAAKAQNLGNQMTEEVQKLMGEVGEVQGQLGKILEILNLIQTLLGGDGAGGGIQGLLSLLGNTNSDLAAIAGIVDQFAGSGDSGGTNTYGDKVKTWIVQPWFMVRAQQSMAQGGGGGSWAYVFPIPASSAGRTKLLMYTWLGVKYYYLPIPESITVRGTTGIAGFPVPRHILNVNFDATSFPPLKVKLIFFKNQKVNVPVNMGAQGTEDEVPTDEDTEKDRADAYKNLRDTAEAVAENKMAAGHILAASRIAALAAASGAYDTLANVLDHMEEIVKNTVISEVGAADAGRASEDFMVKAAQAAQGKIDELIAAIPTETDKNGKVTVKPIDPAKLKSILKGICPPVRKAVASAARTMEALAAATDSQATKRFSEIKFNRMVEWALRAEGQALVALATSQAKVAQRASKIAQAFEAQSKKDSGQVSQAASISSEESQRTVQSVEKATAGTGSLSPSLKLSQRVLANAEDLKVDGTRDSVAAADDATIEVVGEYDPYDHDNTDGSTADTQRGPFSQQSANLVAQAFQAAQQLANVLPHPGDNFVSSGPPTTDVLKQKLAQVQSQVATLNLIRRLLNLGSKREFLAVSQTQSRALASRGKIGFYAAKEQAYRAKAEALILQAASIGNDPNVITEEWTKPGKFEADTVYASTHLKKLSAQQLALMVAQAQKKAFSTAQHAANLAEIANAKEAQAFNLENVFIKRLLGAIVRNAAHAHRFTARAFQAATSICGASSGEKSQADKSSQDADTVTSQADEAAGQVNSAMNTANQAHADAHQARVEAILALVDANLAEEELARLQDVLRTKTQGDKTPGGGTAGTGGGGTGTGGTGGGKPTSGPGSVIDDLIKKIQELMNEGRFDELVKLLLQIINDRGLNDPLGRLAKQILDQILEDAIRVLEEILQSTNSNNNDTIFNGGQTLQDILKNLGKFPPGQAGNDLQGEFGGIGTGGGGSGAGIGTSTGTETTGGRGVGGRLSGGSLFGKGTGGSGTGTPSGTAGRGLADGDASKAAQKLFELAQQKEKEGLTNEAIKIYNQIIEQFPKSEFADPSRERIQALLGDPNKKKELESGAQVFLDRGIELMKQGDDAGAIQMFNVVLNDFPTSPQAPEADKLKKQILSGGLASTPTGGGGGSPQGRVSDPSGFVDEAAMLYAQAQEMEKQGAYPESIKNYDTIVTSFAETDFAKLSQERLDALLGDTRIKQSIEDQAAVLMSRGASMMEAGNLAGALQMFNTVVTDFPTSREVPKAQGNVADINNRLQTGK